MSARYGAGVNVVNFGCRTNIVESEAMRHAAEAAGHRDIVIINTCAVTSQAVRQARQAIRRIHRERPSSPIVVTGCAAQLEPQTFAAMDEVTQVIGNDAKIRLGTWVRRDFGVGLSERVVVNDIMSVRETATSFLDAFGAHTRAFVQVQNGCNHRCTFCIIPYARGHCRSVPIGAVVDQVARLVERGYLEAVLTGIDITSYGSDLPGEPSLGRLVKQVLKHVPSLLRLRLSSVDPVEMDAELLDALATERRLMPHLHLSLQSGDDLVLKRMKRRHTRAQAIRFCHNVRTMRPDVVFGADMIVGFPTESDLAFQRSLDLVAECGLTHCHVFPFSARPGTPAARMPQVASLAIKERAARLRRAGEAAFRVHLTAQIGRTLRILMERGGIGRTEDFTPVRFARAEAGSMCDVMIIGTDGKQLAAD